MLKTEIQGVCNELSSRKSKMKEEVKSLRSLLKSSRQVRRNEIVQAIKRDTD